MIEKLRESIRTRVRAELVPLVEALVEQIVDLYATQAESAYAVAIGTAVTMLRAQIGDLDPVVVETPAPKKRASSPPKRTAKKQRRQRRPRAAVQPKPQQPDPEPLDDQDDQDEAPAAAPSKRDRFAMIEAAKRRREGLTA